MRRAKKRKREKRRRREKKREKKDVNTIMKTWNGKEAKKRNCQASR
jgi:hypothetical protein